MLANPLILLVPGAGIEPAQPLRPRDFKSLASTYSATRAYVVLPEFALSELIAESRPDFKGKDSRKANIVSHEYI